MLQNINFVLRDEGRIPNSERASSFKGLFAYLEQPTEGVLLVFFPAAAQC